MELNEWLLAQASSDAMLSDDAKYAMLEALEGEPHRDAAAESSEGTSAPDEDVTPPVEIFLKEISVEGLRGIGPKASLLFQPHPGLTVVAGRNGSGKSSFAEALDITLSSSTSRAEKKSYLWSNQWRNLHHPHNGGVRVSLSTSRGPLAVGIDWADDQTNWRSGSRWFQQPGQRRDDDVSSLGWDNGFERYDPILSYDELGGLLEQSPTQLHDAIERLLGLDALNRDPPTVIV